MTQVETLTTEQVKCMVKGKGTRIATVTFIKADGTLRTINGLFRPSSHIIGSERGQMQGEAMAARGQIPVYELSSKRWKSFYANKVVSIK
jgi:hypothetical protein